MGYHLQHQTILAETKPPQGEITDDEVREFLARRKSNWGEYRLSESDGLWRFHTEVLESQAGLAFAA